MNPNEILVYQYSPKNECWYDATKDVEWIKRGQNAWMVKYTSKSQFLYVSFRKVYVFVHPKTISFSELLFKDYLCKNVSKLLLFENSNQRIFKIFYENGRTTIAEPKDIRIINNILESDEKAAGVMAYYQTVVHEICKNDEERFLVSQFENIDLVDENSILALYLRRAYGKVKRDNQKPWICPFGLNLSQIEAMKMAFENRISLIEGPPGTGKTQTILNIISNAIINNLSVAVVSNNNTATDNIFEKLSNFGCSFVAAPLGNAENVEQFFAEYNSTIPTMKWSDVNSNKLKNLFYSLPVFCDIENKKKQEIEKLEAVKLEYRHFLSDHQSIASIEEYCNHIGKKAAKTSHILDFIIKYKEKDALGIFDKIKAFFRLSLNKRFFALENDIGLTVLETLFYIYRIKEIKKNIDEFDITLGRESVTEIIDEFVTMSRNYLNNSLIDRYKESHRSQYQKDNYKRLFFDFVKDYPVILSTSYSLAKCSKQRFLFDLLIIDESSQVNMASALIAMRMAKNLVVVGDTKQLPQIDEHGFVKRNEELLKQFHISRSYSYYGNSIMSSILSIYGDKLPKQMLREHYRCDPTIINFCNEEFYHNELIVYKSAKEAENTMRIIKTVPGNFARKNPTGSGLYNLREIDEIEKIIHDESPEDVGIITPYHYQAQLIQEKLGDSVVASTVHKFQGREKKTIILSSVVNDSNDFVGNDNLINVAVSRATDSFILVTSDKITKSTSGVLSDLVSYISYHSFGSINEGSVTSIYDLLYSEYRETLENFRKRYPSKDFDTENLTKVLLDNLLLQKERKNLKFAMHVSLKDFICRDHLSLTNEELAFFSNRNSHVDFLLYNKMSKKPCGAIEVDGVSFHEQKEEQQRRDAKKNAILQKAGIPLLRLKTNESNEKTRIAEFIDSF